MQKKPRQANKTRQRKTGSQLNHSKQQYQDLRNQDYNNNNFTGKAYTIEEAKDYIRDAFHEMGEQGFDFRYVSNYFCKGKRIKKSYHKAYLRFQCPIRSHKRFTTSKGTTKFQFQIQDLKLFHKRQRKFAQPSQKIQRLKNPVIVIWNFYIYHMNCKKCGQMGTPQIYQPQLDRVVNKICELIARILNEEPYYPKKPQRQITPDLVNHRSDLCEACKDGVCSFKETLKQ